MKQTIYHQAQIRPFLVKYLTNAKATIQLAIGWLDDDGLIGLLEKKASEGIDISIVLIENNTPKKRAADFEQLKRKGVKITKLDNTHREYLIDHKFGIIDTSIVLTGNYGWGNKNAPAEDSLIITEDLPTLATGFKIEFDHLSVINYLSKDVSKPANPIILLLKKTEIIKTLLGIGDTDYIHLRLRELKKYTGDENIDLIIQTLRKKSFEEALDLVKTFIQYHQALRECIDPPSDNFRREIKLLEDEIAAISNEYNETQKNLHKFSKLHTANLGDLLQKILLQTKIKAAFEAKADAEKQEDYEEAKKDHEEFTESHELAKKQKLTVLTPQEQKELKKLYRQTSLKCHPDRVVEELHDQAEEFFVALNQAYKANDLERVKEINQQLKLGIMLPKSEGITELKKLESTYKNLTQKLQDWQSKLTELQLLPSYKTINDIEDWVAYFAETKSILEKQLERLIEFNESPPETAEEE